MYELAGETPPGAIPPAKLLAVQQAAIAACDANDGVKDGCMIDYTRTGQFDAEGECLAAGPTRRARQPA